ncbi:hypothetical protein CERSUDRAFT_96082 [Gelatoporia subvermispora B]|uniref:Sodium/calcium exchanger membrane region domain-containing protein n=1 Tax=Ceriporiopsis subvermispora (strain B) TaxID=914234 RepID=M2QFN7_CERS8|nr:hypothetical protein CERSUDRAFT_96082 [Gelatoporia subvermispora B]
MSAPAPSRMSSSAKTYATSPEDAESTSSAHPHWCYHWDIQRPLRIVRTRNKERRKFSVTQSIKDIFASSVLNIFLIFIPFAWVSHFYHPWGHKVTFALCFLGIIPLERLFDWGGEQMAYYLGNGLGDLLIITLDNAVEVTLAIILLSHCELRLLQSTIVGVVTLHLLLIPGTAFLTGGFQNLEQTLSENATELNHSLLMLRCVVMAIMLPTAFLAALDRGLSSFDPAQTPPTLVNDKTRDEILTMSRGLSVLLLVVYICSRIYIYTGDPDSEEQPDRETSNVQKACPTCYNSDEITIVPVDVKPEDNKQSSRLSQQEKETIKLRNNLKIGPGVGFVLLVITAAVMATTAEFLVESIEFVREEGHIQEEWFGLILLPIISFAGDGIMATVRFIASVIRDDEPQDLAKGRSIDLSIQFVLWWMPMLVLLGWWIGKPMHLMFDYFELALLLGSCVLVNYVTADSKTNWVEGLIMIAFYLMIAISAWFYIGQPESAIMLTCGSVAQALVGNSTKSSA